MATLPGEDEQKRLLEKDAKRAKRLRATATAEYFGPRTEGVACAVCGAIVPMPADFSPLCHSCRPMFVRSEVETFPERILFGSPLAAARELGMEVTDADLRWMEQRILAARDPVEEIQWCEAGAHEWKHLRVAGRPPRSCPEHAAVGDTSAEWPGLAASCFLVGAAWATRLFVTGSLLRGSRWRLPLPLCHLVDVEGELRIPPSHQHLGQDLVLTSSNGTCTVGGIAQALRALDVAEGDFVFVGVAPSRWSAKARRRLELRGVDALGKLLWACGMDPHDDEARREPWRAVGRALGGVAADRESVRERLVHRGNSDLVQELDAARPDRESDEATNAGTGWRADWQYASALVGDETRFALRSPGGAVRACLGVSTDGTAHVEGTFMGAGNLVWVDLDGLGDDEDLPHVRTPPVGMVVTALRPDWVRWMRMEHRARGAGIFGVPWTLGVEDRRWTYTATPHADLLEALAVLPPATDQIGRVRGRVVTPYPRSAFAFTRLAQRAVSKGLLSLAGGELGLTATFADGTAVTGLSLSDILDP